MGDNLSKRGVLTAHFIESHTPREAASEPILLGVKDGVYHVHEASFMQETFAAVKNDLADLKQYNEKEFFEKYGDGNNVVSLEDYMKEYQDIPRVVDGLVNRALDIAEKAIELGYEVEAPLNGVAASRFNFEDFKGLPKAAQKQIEEIDQKLEETFGRKDWMKARLADMGQDMKSELAPNAGVENIAP